MMTDTATVSVTLLNHAEIDSDHLAFNQLSSQLKSAAGPEFKVLFQELLQHTEAHFSREEILIEEFNYPGKSEHCSEHNRLLGELRQLNERVQAGRLALARAYINDRVDEWLQQHITNMDAALVKYIEDHS